MASKTIEIYTDGSCLGNPGPGGWGVVILHAGKAINLSGSDNQTTNNRMEMMAIIKALKWLHTESAFTPQKLHQQKIIIHSDSNLLIQTFKQGWKRKANLDLWAELDKLRAWLNIEWKWVKGHHTDHYNKEVDKLAFAAARKGEKAR